MAVSGEISALVTSVYQKTMDNVLLKAGCIHHPDKVKTYRRWQALVRWMNLQHFEQLSKLEQFVPLDHRIVTWHIIFNGDILSFEYFVKSETAAFDAEYKRLVGDFENIAACYHAMCFRQSIGAIDCMLEHLTVKSALPDGFIYLKPKTITEKRVEIDQAVSAMVRLSTTMATK